MNNKLCVVCGHKTSVGYGHVSVQNLPRRLQEAGGFPTKERRSIYHVDGKPEINTWTQVDGPVCHWCERGIYRCKCGRPLYWSAKECDYCSGYRTAGRTRRGRPVDAQRRKVYTLEYRLFHGAAEARLTVEEAMVLAKRVSRRFRTSVPLLEYTRGSGDSASYYSPGFIRIRSSAKRGTCALTVLHEFAHHMVYHIYGSTGFAAHGAQFWRCYKEVMAWAGYFDGRYSMSKYRVKISSQQEFWRLLRARPRRAGR